MELNNMKTILFVDDDSDWRSMVCTWLQGAGYNVIAVKNGIECFNSVERAQPDLVILDVGLDGEDGTLLMRVLKQRFQTMPVILYTGLSHDDDTILELMREGAHQYVRKGKMSDLIDAVRMRLDFEATLN